MATEYIYTYSTRQTNHFPAAPVPFSAPVRSPLPPEGPFISYDLPQEEGSGAAALWVWRAQNRDGEINRIDTPALFLSFLSPPHAAGRNREEGERGNSIAQRNEEEVNGLTHFRGLPACPPI